MARDRIDLLPGMGDRTGKAATRMRQSSDALGRFLRARGYKPIDTPLIEDLELFTRKSGGELGSQLYTFTDPGGRRVSLRPEFTSSVIRHFISERRDAGATARWHYSGPIFRYDGGHEQPHHQFTQVGAEMLGEGGTEADAEILWLAWAGLKELGLRGCRVRIGHLGVLSQLLSTFELSEPAKVFAIGNLQAMSDDSESVDGLMDRAGQTGLVRTTLDADTEALLADLGDATTREIMQRVLKESVSSPVGRRTPEQIVSRLLRKVRAADDPEELRQALKLLRDLSRLEKSPDIALTNARALADERGLPRKAFETIESLLATLRDRGLEDTVVEVDFGLSRGIAYYTGVIFDLLPSGRQSYPLGGGGRYDGLVRALGGARDVPALGFAYNLDAVVAALEAQTQSPATGETAP